MEIWNGLRGGEYPDISEHSTEYAGVVVKILEKNLMI